MIETMLMDESSRVLVFICLPLLLLLVGLIVVLARASRTTAKFPIFSVTISKVGQYEAYVSYRDESRQLELDALIGRGRSFFIPEIRVRVPNEMSGHEQSIVIPNLALGLTKLHYQYVIYRRGEPQIVSQEERNAAIKELREMGVEIQSAGGQGVIQQVMVRDWHKTVGKRIKIVMPQLLALVNTARGTQENIQVLARSDMKGR